MTRSELAIISFSITYYLTFSMMMSGGGGGDGISHCVLARKLRYFIPKRKHYHNHLCPCGGSGGG